MTFVTVRCLSCDSEQVVKRGKTSRGKQRYLCQSTSCAKGSFLLDYSNRGCLPEVKQTIIDMSLNASGIRDTARVLRISTDTYSGPQTSSCAPTNVARRGAHWLPITYLLGPHALQLGAHLVHTAHKHPRAPPWAATRLLGSF